MYYINPRSAIVKAVHSPLKMLLFRHEPVTSPSLKTVHSIELLKDIAELKVHVVMSEVSSFQR